MRAAEEMAEDINGLASPEVVADARDVPVVTLPELGLSNAATAMFAQSTGLLGQLAALVDSGEQDCMTSAMGQSSYGPLGDETHESAVAIDWCYDEDTGDYEIALPVVHWDTDSPIVHFEGWEQAGVQSGSGTIVVYFCTGLDLDGEMVCVDEPDHRYSVLAEGGELVIVPEPS